MAPSPRVWTNNEEQIILCMMCKGLHNQLDDLDLATSFNQALNGGKPDTKDVEPKVVREKFNSLLRERPAFAKLLRFSRTTRVTSTLRKAFNRAIPFDGDKKKVEEVESTGNDSTDEALKTVKDLIIRVEDTNHLPTTARNPFAMDQDALMKHWEKTAATDANSGWGAEDISGTGTAQNQGGTNVTDFAGAWGVENTSGFGVAQDGIGTNAGDTSGGWGTAEDTGFGVGTNLNDQDHRAGATASNARTSNAVNVSRGWGANDMDAGNFMDWTGDNTDKLGVSQKKGKAKATAADDTATNAFEGWGVQDSGNTTTGQTSVDEWGNTTMAEPWVTEQDNTDAALPKGSDAQADVAEPSNANDLAYSGFQEWGGAGVPGSAKRGISLTAPLFVPEAENFDEAPGWNSVRSPNKSPAGHPMNGIIPMGDPDDPAGTWGSNDYEKLARPVAGREDARKVDWSGLYDERAEDEPSKDWERETSGKSGTTDIQAADDITSEEPSSAAGKNLWTEATATPATRQTKNDDTPAPLPPRIHNDSSPMMNPARLARLADLSSDSPEPPEISPTPAPRKRITFTGSNAAPIQPRRPRSAAFGAKSAFTLETTGAAGQESQGGVSSPVTPTWRVPGVDGHTPWASREEDRSSSPFDHTVAAGGDIKDQRESVPVKKKNNDSNDNSKKISRDGGGGS
ncbi:MAG: hypothetical protein M1824_002073 [Vezdaea acicularis]|nr:MAG: hypothetical protein M1824_002073 [Vezdaea acicularis]